MFNAEQFRNYIIVPTLSKMQLYSKAAEELLMFTCATESLGGTYLVQVKGPAIGVYQMEPNTYSDIWFNFMRHQPRLSMLMATHFDCVKIPAAERMIGDMYFATAMARLHYFRVKQRLPDADDIEGIWKYYKQFYNTERGKATRESSVEKYCAWVSGQRKNSKGKSALVE